MAEREFVRWGVSIPHGLFAVIELAVNKLEEGSSCPWAIG